MALRNLYRMIACLLVIGLVAAACGTDDDEAPEATQAATQATQAATTTTAAAAAAPETTEAAAPETTEAAMSGPQRGGTLVFARQLETNTLNPFELSDNGQIYAHELIFDTLVYADPKGGTSIIPALAESWEVSDDGLDWTFTLRENARFSNGDPVTSEDVQYSIDRFADPEINTILPFLALGYTGTEIVDDRNFIIHLDQPIAAFLENISIFPAYIVPKAVLEAQGDAFWEDPVGSGPFKLKEWIRGTSISFEPNPYYWEEGKPYLDELRYDFIVDDNTRALKLDSGEAQVMESVPFTQIDAVGALDNVTVLVREVTRQEPVWINNGVPPLDEVAVRQALSYATDREAINVAVFGGVGTIPNHLIPPLKYNASTSEVAPFSFDLDKAKELMASSSVPDGFSVTFQFPAGSGQHKSLATVLQAQWAEIGVDLQLVELDESTLADNLFSYGYEITMPFLKWTSDVLVPDEFALLMADPTDAGLDGFFSAWGNESVWAKVEEAVAATEKRRQELWPKIQAEWVADMPWLNILWLPLATGVRDGVHDVDQDALGVYHFENTWIEQ